jgi:hypothetical protein
MAQVVEYMPSKCKALSSNPITIKKKKPSFQVILSPMPKPKTICLNVKFPFPAYLWNEAWTAFPLPYTINSLVPPPVFTKIHL